LASAVSDGALDTTFGTGGKATTDIGGGQDMGNSTALQSDGKIIVAGSSGDDFAVVRYNTDGSLDTSFDTDGKATTDINGGIDSGQSVAIQSNGKIIVVGQGRSGLNQNFAVVRYNTDGSLDTSFDTDGKVTTDIGNSSSDIANAVVIQGDGNIVVAGESSSDFAVVRYTTTGALDTTFDTDGKATTDIGTSSLDSGSAVAIQSDSKIVVAGTSSSDFAVARYTTTGALDTTFDTDGKATTDIGTSTSDTGSSAAIQSDGKIVVAGKSASDFAVARYTTTGALDTTFDTDGKATTDIGTSTSDTGKSVAIQSDGKIVVAGDDSSDFAVVRYTTTGALDTTFDTDGKATTDIGTSTSDMGKSAVIQSGGKIIVAGARFSGNWDFVVIRYEATATSPSSTSTSSSTSTTVAAATTTTVAAATTTTVAAATTTTTNVVVNKATAAAVNTSSTTLPVTGSSSSLPATIGALLVVVGLVLATRRRLVD
jgi:uncharacterized delta-60 repeat protein/LPXTG-motif cell wall-anchored protein